MQNRHFSVSLAVNRETIEANASGKIIVCCSVWHYLHCMQRVVMWHAEKMLNNDKTFSNRTLHNRTTNHKFSKQEVRSQWNGSDETLRSINQIRYFSVRFLFGSWQPKKKKRMSWQPNAKIEQLKLPRKSYVKTDGKAYYRIGICTFFSDNLPNFTHSLNVSNIFTFVSNFQRTTCRSQFHTLWRGRRIQNFVEGGFFVFFLLQKAQM